MSSSLRCLVSLVLLCACATSAHALRCGNRVVNTDDADFQVRDRCGEPYWTEDHYALIVSGADTALETRQEVVYTAWFYNFGSTRLLVRLLFRNGRLVREDTLDRGVDTLGDSCGPAKLTRGISSGELVAYCGAPSSRHEVVSEQVRRFGRGYEHRSNLYREEWVYDLGGNFLYVLNLLNGRVDSVESTPR